MPDTIFRLGDPPTPLRAHDNGDGSFSLATFSGAATTGAPVTRGALTSRGAGTTPDAADHVIAPANAARSYLLFQNNHATQDLWIDFDAAAVIGPPSILVAAGGAIVWETGFVPNGALHAIGPSGTTYTCKEG